MTSPESNDTGFCASAGRIKDALKGTGEGWMFLVMTVFLVAFYPMLLVLDPEYWPSGSDILGPAILCFISPFALTIQIRSWWSRTRTLTRGEHYVVLSYFAMVASAIFAAANYAIWLLDETAFSADADVVAVVQPRRQAQAKRYNAESQQIIDACDNLRGAVTALGMADSGWHLDAASGPSQIGASEFRTQAGFDGPDVISVASEGHPHFVLSENYGAPIRLPVTHRDLADALHGRALWEASAQRGNDKRFAQGFRTYALWPFLYQSIMEVLQSSPQFFKPISLAAQGVSFAFAALRFFFFGVVVGFVTRAVRTKDLSAA